MNRFNAFIKESYSELMTKVSWPTWDELQSSATIVSVAAVVIALVVLLMDAASNFTFSTFYSAFNK
jgi:preprotein translocase subunit SecE